MKTLNDYADKAVSSALKKFGGFFAFSDKQFEEAKDPNLKRSDYCKDGSGLIAPKKNMKALVEAINKAYDDGIKIDLAENGKKAIIKRELYNHEAFYTYSTEDTAQALKAYGITPEEVSEVFKEECDNAVKNMV